LTYLLDGDGATANSNGVVVLMEWMKVMKYCSGWCLTMQTSLTKALQAADTARCTEPGETPSIMPSIQATDPFFILIYSL
jgi:hypothetical protein